MNEPTISRRDSRRLVKFLIKGGISRGPSDDTYYIFADNKTFRVKVLNRKPGLSHVSVDFDGQIVFFANSWAFVLVDKIDRSWRVDIKDWYS